MNTKFKKSPLFWRELRRGLIFTIIASLIYVACQKEDESENPYVLKKIELSDYEKSFLTLNLHDTLYYADENLSCSSGAVVDSNYFYLVGDIDTVITDSKIEYTYSLMHASNIGGEGNIKFKIVYTKTANYFDMSVLIWDVTLIDNPVARTINGLLCHYDTLRLNNFLYNDVYHIEADTTYNSSHCAHIHRAFFAPNYGLISVTDDCNSLYFYNL